MTDVADLVRRSREPSLRETFAERVTEQAAILRSDIEAGRLDNEDPTIGLELEVYAVDDAGKLVPVPDVVLDVCAKEIGRHNAELNTDPSRFDETGIETQKRDLTEQFEHAQAVAGETGLDLVLDALWTTPPAGGTSEYLANTTGEDVVLATNMRTDARYHALDNDVLGHRPETTIEVPGGQVSAPTVFVESLATSMQPHLQIPNSEVFPRYFNAAIRTLGPVLALATNAPFLPADCYALDGEEAIDAIERAPHELRIPIFERAMNVESPGKVRVPRDLASAAAIPDRLVADRICGPFLREWVTGELTDIEAGSGPDTDFDAEGTTSAEVTQEYEARLWELDYKRSTYWRWVRPVFAGTPVAGACGERSLRIEYRSIPTQPSVEDVCNLAVLVEGLLWGLVTTDHPIEDLSWEAATKCFYDVVERGLDGDLAWVNRDGERVHDPEAVYADCFAVARQGLAERGVSETTIDRYLDPIEDRFDARTAPSDWKKREVSDRVENGADLETAIEGMQRAYIERAGTPFVEWL
jgi:hypothetical protein